MSFRHVGATGDLHQAVTIAQINEDQTAQIPAAVYPPAQAHFAADVLGPQLSAPVRTQRRRAHLSHAANRDLIIRVATQSPTAAPVASATQSESAGVLPGMRR